MKLETLELICPKCKMVKLNPVLGLEFYVIPCPKCKEPLLVTGNGMTALDKNKLNGAPDDVKAYIKEMLLLHLADTDYSNLHDTEMRLKIKKLETVDDFFDVFGKIQGEENNDRTEPKSS